MTKSKGEGAKALSLKLDNYIDMPIDSILRALVKRLAEERDQRHFIDFVRRAESLYRVRISRNTKALQRGFELFTPETVSTEVNFSANNIEAEEDIFLSTLHENLRAANYELLSQKEYEDAIAEDFMLDLDLKFNKNEIDSGFIKRFHEQSKQSEVKDAADITKHVLVYHRGTGLEKASGFFLLQKVDYVFSFFFAMFNILFMILLGFLQVWKWPSYMRALNTSNDDNMDMSDSNAPRMHVNRVSLRTLLKSSILNLLATCHLQEPSFDEMIIVYRLKADVDHCKPGSPPKIQVKAFRNIPRADFEIVLPAQSPRTRSIDLVKLLAAIGVGMATLFSKFHGIADELTDDEPWFENLRESLPVLIAVGSYVVKVLVQFRAQKNSYNALVTSFLYNRTLDTDDGVRTHLIESTLMQEVKELILAYFFLWQRPAQTLDELDQEVERFFESLGHQIDFEVEDGVQKLIIDGLATVQPEGPLGPNSLINPTSMASSMKILKHKWDHFFVDPDQDCPYCPYINDHSVSFSNQW